MWQQNAITSCLSIDRLVWWFETVDRQWHHMMNELGSQTVDNRIHCNCKKLLLEFLTVTSGFFVTQDMWIKSLITSSFQSVNVPGIAVHRLRACPWTVRVTVTQSNNWVRRRKMFLKEVQHRWHSGRVLITATGGWSACRPRSSRWHHLLPWISRDDLQAEKTEKVNSGSTSHDKSGCEFSVWSHFVYA